MKWLKEIYSLFVDDPRLALLALVVLVVSALLAHLGIRTGSGLMIFLGVSVSLWYSVRRN